MLHFSRPPYRNNLLCIPIISFSEESKKEILFWRIRSSSPFPPITQSFVLFVVSVVTSCRVLLITQRRLFFVLFLCVDDKVTKFAMCSGVFYGGDLFGKGDRPQVTFCHHRKLGANSLSLTVPKGFNKNSTITNIGIIIEHMCI